MGLSHNHRARCSAPYLKCLFFSLNPANFALQVCPEVFGVPKSWWHGGTQGPASPKLAARRALQLETCFWPASQSKQVIEETATSRGEVILSLSQMGNSGGIRGSRVLCLPNLSPWTRSGKPRSPEAASQKCHTTPALSSEGQREIICDNEVAKATFQVRCPAPGWPPKHQALLSSFRAVEKGKAKWKWPQVSKTRLGALMKRKGREDEVAHHHHHHWARRGSAPPSCPADVPRDLGRQVGGESSLQHAS